MSASTSKKKLQKPVATSPPVSQARGSVAQIAHEFDFAEQGAGTFLYRRTRGDELEAEVRAGFSVEDMVLAQLDERALQPLEADLRDVVVSLHLADRLALRRPKHGRDTAAIWWARLIKVRLPVRQPDRWNEIAVKAALQKYLFKNTGDKWELEFVSAIPSSSNDADLPIEDLGVGRLWRRRLPERVIVALFSGGVDSTGGLAHEARQFPDAHFILVSVNTNSAANARQSDLVRLLPAEARSRVTHIRIGLRLHNAKELSGLGQKGASEKSLRTRGLLFLAAGALVARRVGQQRFYVYENGFGALNLSFDRSQVRGQANRAVHPESLALFGQFVTALFRAPLEVDNPFLFETKAALCRALDFPGWRELIGLTFTCGHPQRIAGEGVWHCGSCTSCISRRQGFHAANMSREDAAKYDFDPSAPLRALDDKSAEWLKVGTQLRAIKRAIAGSPQSEYEAIWKRLRAEFPDLRDLEMMSDIAFKGNRLSPAELRFGLVKLLRGYIAEGIALTPVGLQKLNGGKVEESLFLFDERRAA